ncbi:MAG: thiamine phosphate synthase [Rhizobiaceae bacterium]
MGDRAILHYSAQDVRALLAAGDVASVVFYANELEETAFQQAISPLVEAAQVRGVAALVAGESRVAGRVGADGLHLGADVPTLAEAIDKFAPGMIVGAGNVKTRHAALIIGEIRPDYVMFGKPGGDSRPEPHPKNLALGDWWSQMVEIPCIVLGGSSIDSALVVAKSGADFVALENAIFTPENGPINMREAENRLRQANEMLDQNAPRFETVED